MSYNNNYDKISYLKKDAKILLKRIHSCESGAVKRFCNCCHPDFLVYSTAQLVLNIEKVKLYHVHWMIAHELGYTSWTKLKTDLESSAAHEILILNFIRNSLVCVGAPDKSTYTKALSLLNSTGSFISSNRLISLITGNSEPILNHLKNNPEWASNKIGPKKWTPLLYVSNSIFIYSEFNESNLLSTDFETIVSALIDSGADPDDYFYLDDFRNTSKTVADGFAQAGRSDLLSLLNRSATHHYNFTRDIGRQTDAVYSDGVDFGDKFGKIFLKKQSFMNSYALLNAVANEGLYKILELLENGADPNYICPALKTTRHGISYSEPSYRANSPLAIALDKGRDNEILNALISFGADPFQIDCLRLSPINIAMRYGRLIFLSDLRRKTGAIPEGISILDEFWCAVFIGEKEEAVNAFKKNNLKTEQGDLHSIQLFSKAAFFGNEPAIEVLIELGFSQHHSDDKGMTPLHWAVWRADVKTVRALLKAEPPLDKINCYKATPLDIAIYSIQKQKNKINEYLEIIEMLIAAGCDLDKDKRLFVNEVRKLSESSTGELVDFFWMEGFISPDSKLEFHS